MNGDLLSKSPDDSSNVKENQLTCCSRGEADLNVCNRLSDEENLNQNERQQNSEVEAVNYVKCNRQLTLPSSASLDDFNVVFIGESGRLLVNLMMTMSKNPFVVYNPETQTAWKETLNVSRELMKRYYMIERAKDARIVGIVAGTLSVAKTREMIDHLKKIIKDAGKRSYVIAVGKLNVAKLANFMEVCMNQILQVEFQHHLHWQ